MQYFLTLIISILLGKVIHEVTSLVHEKLRNEDGMLESKDKFKNNIRFNGEYWLFIGIETAASFCGIPITMLILLPLQLWLSPDTLSLMVWVTNTTITALWLRWLVNTLFFMTKNHCDDYIFRLKQEREEKQELEASAQNYLPPAKGDWGLNDNRVTKKKEPAIQKKGKNT